MFEEKAGVVPITLRRLDEGTLWCELKAPADISLGTVVPVETLASALSLPTNEIVTDTHFPQVASVGLPFIIAELRDQSALKRAKVTLNGFQEIADLGMTPDIHIYTRSYDECDIRARMFSPFDGIPEDPATGSANCALGGLLAHSNPSRSGHIEWQIAQGVEMGRPSLLKVRAEKKDGHVISTWVGGRCVMVSEGVIYID